MPEWELVYHNPLLGYAEYERELDENNVVVRHEWYDPAPFLEANAALLKESEGRKFGDGQIVASIPMHVWARDLAQPIREGDDAYVKRYLNDPENRAYRTFRGKV